MSHMWKYFNSFDILVKRARTFLRYDPPNTNKMIRTTNIPNKLTFRDKYTKQIITVSLWNICWSFFWQQILLYLSYFKTSKPRVNYDTYEWWMFLVIVCDAFNEHIMSLRDSSHDNVDFCFYWIYMKRNKD